jgi:hypothetical protein
VPVVVKGLQIAPGFLAVPQQTGNAATLPHNAAMIHIRSPLQTQIVHPVFRCRWS